MTTLVQLKRRAKNTAEFWRGHKMTRFENVDGHRHLSTCISCTAQVVVNTRPQPNEIDIGGEAVALNCPAKR